MSNPYWHELTNEQRTTLYGNATWGHIMENYKQPEWCRHFEALRGDFGCNSLVSSDLVSQISKDYCKNCELSIAKEL